MSEDAIDRWMPSTSATVAYAVKKLVQEGNGERAVGILVVEILKGKFASVINTLATNTQVSEAGIRTLLSDIVSDSYAMRLTYELAGLPPALYPLFATAVDLILEVVRVRKASLTPQIRGFVLEKVLTTPAVVELKLSEPFIANLRTYAGTPTEAQPSVPTAPEAPPPSETPLT